MSRLLEVTALDSALGKGMSFLSSMRDEEGLWHDFRTPAGFSIEWVSGFVLASIAGLPGYRSMAYAAADSLIRKRRISGGWGYNQGIPEDCDTTAWVLVSLISHDSVRPLVIQRGIDFIIGHQDASTGGFSTFQPVGEVQDLVKRAGSGSGSPGWLRPQTCVTAVSVIALLLHGKKSSDSSVAAAVRYIQRQRDSSGLWSSYWWNDIEYSTFYSTLALSMARLLKDSDRVEIADSLLERANSDGGWGQISEFPGNNFATSLALLTIMLAPLCKRTCGFLHRGMRWLLDRQLEDGSWDSVPILRIRESELGESVIVPDHQRIFTTASVLKALKQYRLFAPVFRTRFRDLNVSGTPGP